MNGPITQADCTQAAYVSPSVRPEERRRDPRYRPLAASAYVGWWEGETFRTELGVIQNVSTGGAAVTLPAPPADGAAVWLCLVGPGRVTWVAARLLGVDGQIARLQFAEPCAESLIAPLIWGLS